MRFCWTHFPPFCVHVINGYPLMSSWSPSHYGWVDAMSGWKEPSTNIQVFIINHCLTLLQNKLINKVSYKTLENIYIFVCACVGLCNYIVTHIMNRLQHRLVYFLQWFISSSGYICHVALLSLRTLEEIRTFFFLLQQFVQFTRM